jgi:D-glycero-alpha-D-manno-heptose-7-phosphate kinase
MRISFMGGGTDFPNYYRLENKIGRVLATTINKSVYVYALPQPNFENVKFRFNYRTSESVTAIEQINHPVVRETLKQMNWHKPLNMGTMADLPGRSGLGSSSAFTAGFISLISKMNGDTFDSLKISQLAIKIEREILQENGGHQDQLVCAIGGFRLYEFTDNKLSYSETIDDSFCEYLSQCIFLFAPSGERLSKDFAKHTQLSIDKANATKDTTYYDDLSSITLETYSQIIRGISNNEKMRLLADGINEAWKIKKKITMENSQETLQVIDRGLKAGAIAAKLCGAGGQGFIAFLVPPEQTDNFILSFSSVNLVRASIANDGVTIWEI